MAADLILFYISLSCKKFKIIFTLKRGHKGKFIWIKRILNRRPFFNKVYSLLFFTQWCSLLSQVGKSMFCQNITDTAPAATNSIFHVALGVSQSNNFPLDHYVCCWLCMGILILFHHSFSFNHESLFKLFMCLI